MLEINMNHNVIYKFLSSQFLMRHQFSLRYEAHLFNEDLHRHFLDRLSSALTVIKSPMLFFSPLIFLAYRHTDPKTCKL